MFTLNSAILQRMSNLMSQEAKSRIGRGKQPDEDTVRNILNEYFRETKKTPIEFDGLDEMMDFISEVILEEVFEKR